MRIQHLIDGETVESKDYFETVDPATQQVLAEVASGSAAEVHAAVAAAKAAFPAWARRPATERAALMNKLGDLIQAHVPELSGIHHYVRRDRWHSALSIATCERSRPAHGVRALMHQF